MDTHLPPPPLPFPATNVPCWHPTSPKLCFDRQIDFWRLKFINVALEDVLEAALKIMIILAYLELLAQGISRQCHMMRAFIGSTSGYCVFLDNNLLSWPSKRQMTLSLSNVDAEYQGFANAVAETCWLRNLLRELHTPLFLATLV
ncbi:ribonuclease H-like domain-containing protein [Tanacetum coccineum]